MLQGFHNAFELTETEVDKSSGKKEYKNENDFPHLGRIIHKHPRAIRGCNVLCRSERRTLLERTTRFETNCATNADASH